MFVSLLLLKCDLLVPSLRCSGFVPGPWTQKDPEHAEGPAHEATVGSFPALEQKGAACQCLLERPWSSGADSTDSSPHSLEDRNGPSASAALAVRVRSLAILPFWARWLRCSPSARFVFARSRGCALAFF